MSNRVEEICDHVSFSLIITLKTQS